MESVVSNVIKISKDILAIERELPKLCGGEIIRWAIVDITDDFYKVSFSYKK